jgi:hypothetical protein
MKCKKCNTEFVMGENGITVNGEGRCDSCANVTRTPSGEFYENDAPYEVRRPLTSAYGNAAGPRPGDFAVVHPYRKRNREK